MPDAARIAIPSPLPADREIDLELVYAVACEVTSLNFTDQVPALCRLLAEARGEIERLRAEVRGLEGDIEERNLEP